MDEMPKGVGKKIQVAVERIREAREFLRSLNKYDLKDIAFTEGGEVLEIPQQFIDDFKFIGMCNYDFIDSDFYKDGWMTLMLPDEEKALKAVGFVQSAEGGKNNWHTKPDADNAYHMVTRLPDTYEWYWADGYGHHKVENFKTFEELLEWMKDHDDKIHEAAIENGLCD
jgi:hypothetical protein